MSFAERAYEAAMRAGAPVLRAASVFDEKLARGVAGRRQAAAHLERWAGRHRDPTRPLIWFHAPSAGEALMAQATIGAIRCLRHEVQIAFTYFSPSAERIVARVGADVSGYVPWDVTSEAVRAVRALRPSAIAFVRTEVWPVLARVAHGEGVALTLINAVLAEGSSRLRPAARLLLRPAYGRLDAVGAVTNRDARRFERLGVPSGRIHVTGDARFDQVVRRLETRDSESSVVSLVRAAERASVGEQPPDVPLIVAGSTWPQDEAVLIEALVRLRASVRPRLILVPHEPTTSHVRSLEARLARAGLRSERLSDIEERSRIAEHAPPYQPPPAGGRSHAPAYQPPAAEGRSPGAPSEPAAPRGRSRTSRSHLSTTRRSSSGPAAREVMIVDRLGVLADLYAAATIAYVGGGFGRSGLHSVIEPAALGVPVLFGPRAGGAGEAQDLVREGGGFVVRNAAELSERIAGLLADAALRRQAGAAAAALVEAGRGGAERNAMLVLRLLNRLTAQQVRP